MKKHLLIFVLCVCAAIGVYAQTPTNGEDISRKVNCFVNYNPYVKGHGTGSFYTGDPSQVTLQGALPAEYSIYCGAAANGNYYGMVYLYDNIDGAFAVSFSKIDMTTGHLTEIADWRDKGQFKLQDMTYDYSTSTMYAVGFENGNQQLYTIDLETGTLTWVAEMAQSRAVAIACTYSGDMYGIALMGMLFKIDKTTGGVDGSWQPLRFNEGFEIQTLNSLEFDHTDESLYWSCNAYKFDVSHGNVPTAELIKININDHSYKSLGEFPKKVENDVTLRATVYGLYIPFLTSGFDAPGICTDFTATAGAEGALSSELVWTTPSVTFGGETLETISSVVITRDGVEIATITENVAPATTMTYTDETPTQGNHQYEVYVTSGDKNGAPERRTIYVGFDAPGRVEALTATPEVGCGSIALSWEAPTAGNNNGYYSDENLTYTITRFPDKKVVSQNQAERTFNDKTASSRLLRYSYEVVASNNEGAGAVSTTSGIVSGKAIDIAAGSYTTDFYDAGKRNNEWTTFDANNDLVSWYFCTGMGEKVFLSDFPAAEYILDFAVQEDANDWLISPPMALVKDQKYKLSFECRNNGTDILSVTLGQTNTIEGQTTPIKNEIEIACQAEKVPFAAYFTAPNTDNFCLGFHLTTAYMQGSFLQLTNIVVEETQETGIEENEIDNVRMTQENGSIRIEGDFVSARIIAMNGQVVAEMQAVNGVATSAALTQGIYVVQVIGKNAVKSDKIVVTAY